ncbi:MAG: WYL domain-containing protein [Proteobacteria bacterium]|nr:WYL domain-containing protein [Pseudomonadota bacterium]
MADESDVRWGLKQRLEFIEWRAFWDGRVNRRDLEECFHISTPQASADFARYQEAAAENITYDATEKTYVTRPDFRPKFLRLSPERYLLQLEALATEAIHKSDTWFDGLPPVDGVPRIARGPEAFVLRAILDAVRRRNSIEIFYQSLTRTGSRVICPHALAHDGHRWHVRALSQEHGEFRDYVLGRILSFSPPAPCDMDPQDDVEWNTFGTLKLIAHPGLNDSQRRTIEHDYRIQNGELQIQMRLALVYYFIRRNSLDLRTADMPPERAQLYLQNYDEITAACDAAKTEGRNRAVERRQNSREV